MAMVNRRSKNAKWDQAKLIFVYNADSGLWNGIKDFAVKTFNPSNYQCNLCGITYGLTGKKGEWKSFVEDLPIDVSFLHKDELLKRFDPDVQKFPCAYFLKEGDLQVFIEQKKMDSFQSLEELKESILKKLNSLDQTY